MAFLTGAAPEILVQYKKSARKKTVFICVLFFVLCGFAMAALFQGPSAMSARDVLLAVFSDTGAAHAIVWELRLPRIVMAILVGCGLALAGAVFQAILKNPLASPFTLGIASSAGFGAVCAIIFCAGIYKQSLIAINAFGFALVSSFFILGIARLKGATTQTMVLAGIAVMFLFSSLSSLLQYMGTMEQVHEIVFWFFGSLGKAGWKEAGIAAVMILGPMPVLFWWSWDLNVLATGDETAGALGINVARIRMGAVILASLITAGAICFTGVIGFIGLVAPHIARMTFGGDHRILLPASALIGAIIVLSADILGRTLWAPQVIPIGIVTSFVGVPFFFFLLMKKAKEYW